MEELDRVIDETEKGPLNEADRQKLRTALHAHGGKTGTAAQYGEDERRARGSGQSLRPSEEAQPEDEREQACRARPQWRECVSRR